MENHFKAMERIHKIHELILHESTGTPDEFARCLHISRRQLYLILKHFTDLGVSIKYSRIRNTFFYRNNKDSDIVSMLKLYYSGDSLYKNVTK